MTARIAVLASGGGTNLQAMLDHFGALGSAAAGTVVLVASNRETAGALARARARGIAAVHVAHDDGAALLDLLARHDVDLVALAGYLKLVPAPVVTRYRGRLVNVHPGPLPDFGGAGMFGRRVHAAVLKAAVSQTAVTVHLVTERYDEGPVLARWPVPVRPADTPETLGARVLAAEHIVYPRIVDALAAACTAHAVPDSPR